MRLGRSLRNESPGLQGGDYSRSRVSTVNRLLSLVTPDDPNLSRYNRSEGPIVPDRLYLSCWIPVFNESNMLRHFGRKLSLFPYSKLAK